MRKKFTCFVLIYLLCLPGCLGQAPTFNEADGASTSQQLSFLELVQASIAQHYATDEQKIELCQQGAADFLTRPESFAESLNLDTLKSNIGLLRPEWFGSPEQQCFAEYIEAQKAQNVEQQDSCLSTPAGWDWAFQLRIGQHMKSGLAELGNTALPKQAYFELEEALCEASEQGFWGSWPKLAAWTETWTSSSPDALTSVNSTSFAEGALSAHPLAKDGGASLLIGTTALAFAVAALTALSIYVLIPALSRIDWSALFPAPELSLSIAPEIEWSTGAVFTEEVMRGGQASGLPLNISRFRTKQHNDWPSEYQCIAWCIPSSWVQDDRPYLMMNDGTQSIVARFGRFPFIGWGRSNWSANEARVRAWLALFYNIIAAQEGSDAADAFFQYAVRQLEQAEINPDTVLLSIEQDLLHPADSITYCGKVESQCIYINPG
ncbi:MAG: hypothetical protein IPJ88_05040 [Myxococcales bacterium]|nr:MAG: hypothetical protein IPJ88_05040 [Myxococcales bacterium]